MATDRRFLRTCTLCSHSFITRCSNAKYCEQCRVIARKMSSIRYQEKRKDIKAAKPKFTIYTCKRCGKTIKAHGVCTNRSICDECLTSGRRRDLVYLENRKDVLEEVI
jgi:hypothetical protein